jgi:hypothetical protein
MNNNLEGMWKEAVVTNFRQCPSVCLSNRLVLYGFAFHAALSFNFRIHKSPGTGIATGYGLDGRVVKVRVPEGSRIFSTSSRPTLGSTQPPIEWVPGPLSPGRGLFPPAGA